MFEPETYLARLGLTHPPVGVEGLRDMQAAHMANVPFENVDPFLGNVPSLAPDALFEKIVHPNGTYRVRFDEAFDETVVELARGGNWYALYGFDRFPVRSVDLEAANHLSATWRRAPFGTHLMMARHGADGHTTLFNRRLRRAGSTHVLAGSAELGEILLDCFAMPLPHATIETLWERIRGLPNERPS